MAIPQLTDLAALHRAAIASPDSIDRWVDLCEAAEAAQDYEEVLRAGDQIARLAPNKPQAHFIRGLALHRLDRIGEAVDVYRKVTELDPGYVDAWINLGHIYQALNRLAEAEQACRRAIDAGGQTIKGEGTRDIAEEEYGHHHWNLAFLELLKGDYENGFRRYPSRFKAIAGRKRPDFPQPLWRGEDVRGKTILITVDQGHGDTLMMTRYLPLLRERGAKVLLQAQPALVPYLRGWNGADQILEWGRDALPAFDCHASEFDLPRYFGTTLNNVPAKVPYLPLPDPDDETRLPQDGRRKVALTWSGNPNHRNDIRRSVTLRELAPLFTVPGIGFYAVTRDMRPGDAEFLTQTPVTDLSPRLNDFAATARFINQCDLVISCDTSVAHLAGGMGKPLWVLLPFAPSWCWMLDRDDNPWYPTARLFRQTRRGDWAGVAANVRQALENFDRV
ncbi:MAG: tetratricopeptide repeat protein [Bdellovibrionales bacterium]